MVELIQIMLGFDNHVIGMSMAVGIIIFSIARGLGFVHSRYHMYLIPLLVGTSPVLPRRLQILAG